MDLHDVHDAAFVDTPFVEDPASHVMHEPLLPHMMLAVLD